MGFPRKEESYLGACTNPPPPSPPFPKREGKGREEGRKGEAELGRRPSRIPPTWGTPLPLPSLSHLYMRGGGS